MKNSNFLILCLCVIAVFTTLIITCKIPDVGVPPECAQRIDSADKSVFLIHIKDTAGNRAALSRYVPSTGGRVQEYFTGLDFSTEKRLEFQIPEHDSCQLKYLYFEYLNKNKSFSKIPKY